MTQTAVDWLQEELKGVYESDYFNRLLEQAKEMEKEQKIEFAKMHIEKIMNLQQSKYYAGETGYITKKEWQDLLNVK